MFRSTAAVGTHHAETVGVVDQDAEIVFLLEGCDLVEDAERAGHAIDAFGDQQHTAAVLFGFLAGAREDHLAVFDIVVAVFVLAAHVQADAVEQAGVALVVIDDHVVAAHERVDSRDNALVAEVEQEGVFLLLEVGQFAFEALVERGVTRQHAGTHRIGQAPAGGRFAVHLADFGMIGQSQVVVQAPAEDFLTLEAHVRTELPFQLGEHEIAEGFVAVLPQGAAGIFCDSFKNIHDAFSSK